MQVLKLLMCFSISTVSICLVGALISARAVSMECLYFGSELPSPLTVFVPCVFFGLLHIIVAGFAANLYCYHVWLRKHDLTTLEHILKYKGARKISQVQPLASAPSEQTNRSDRAVFRPPLKLRSDSNSAQSKEDELILSSDKRLQSQKSMSSGSEGFLLGRPKTKLEKAEEYFRKSEKKLSSKQASESSQSMTGKESSNMSSTKEQKLDKNTNPTSIINHTPSKFLAKPIVELKAPESSSNRADQEKNTGAKKVSKRKLPPLNSEITENSKNSPSKQ